MNLRPTDTAEDVHFLLLPKFSMLGFVSALEPLRVANRFRPNSYRWHIVSVDGQPVAASDGIALMADHPIAEVAEASCVFVVAGFNPLDHHTTELSAWLHRLDQRRAVLGAIDSGCFNLAAAGLLKRERITMHWEAIPAFIECYPGPVVTQELFEISERRITCAGGTASIDMMLDLIARKHGSDLAVQVSEQFVQGRIRQRSDHQRMQIGMRYGVCNKKITQVLNTMEQHTEVPLSVDELAEVVCVTRRQLERLFKLHLGDTPSNFYLRLRLDQARRLLQQTQMSIVEVSVACGFESASYFSRAYRTRFGVTPSGDRVAKVTQVRGSVAAAARDEIISTG
jgi:AraC family transcriptional regulator, carnitine catabolism transcriptional activator